jgi:acyl-CoA thioester hydrolase
MRICILTNRYVFDSTEWMNGASVPALRRPVRNGWRVSLRTFSGVVYPAQADAMGHMTVQYYVAAFDQAMWHLVHDLGYRPEWQTERDEGWADVRHELTFMKELRVGSLFWVESSVVAVGTTSITTRHRLFNADGEPSSTDEIKSVYYDLKGRKSLPLPDAIRRAASGRLNSAGA